MEWTRNLRGDLAGGLMSAALAVPLAMGYGMFAFVALGDQYFVHGVLAGLITAVVVGVASVALGDRSGRLYAPRITSTFLLGGLVFHLLQLEGAGGARPDLAATLAGIFCIVLLGGAFQFAFGMIRLGTLIKFVPHPVMAGFQNAAAALIFLVQLGNVMGFERATPFAQALRHVDQAKPASIGVALIAIAGMLLSKRIAARVPGLVIGLALGTVAYYALVLAGFDAALGPVIGTADPVRWRRTLPEDTVRLLFDRDTPAMLTAIITGALAIAIIASIDALLCAKLLARPGEPRIDGNRLLVELGVGNMLAAACGGITGGINLGPSLVNRANGGGTPLSVVVNAAALLLIIGVLFPLVAYLPRAVLSAVLMVVAVQHFDPWTVRTLRHGFTRDTTYHRNVVLDLLVVLVVTAGSIFLNIVLAVIIGIGLAVLLFLVRMSRSIVRRSYTSREVRSRKSRAMGQMAALELHGAPVVIVELQGALFFGTAETLAGGVAAKCDAETRYVVLDFRRVSEIDSTGARLLQDMHADLAARGVQLLMAVAQPSETAQALAGYSALEATTAHPVFADVDRAIEWAEDDLLGRNEGVETGEIEFARLSFFEGFAPADLAAVEPRLRRVSYAPGSVIFRQGDIGEELFIIAAGTASAFLHAAAQREVRLATFSPNTVFGELAILDPGVRSATLVADTELVCYVLSDRDFAMLCEQASPAAIKMLANLSRVLSRRLRQATRTINELEQ